MKLTDHESDTAAALRLGSPPETTANRESWLSRLARWLAPIPVDHMPIVSPAPAACCAPARCC